jgi:hypothetical protein
MFATMDHEDRHPDSSNGPVLIESLAGGTFWPRTMGHLACTYAIHRPSRLALLAS